MTKLISLLVGAHFRPPAKTLLTILRPGTPLSLRPEPDNPYDSGAIQVILSIRDINLKDLESPKCIEALESQGFAPEDIFTQPEWMLGYVARDGNKDLAKIGANTGLTLVGNTSFQGYTEAKLRWGPSGEAMLVVETQDDA